MIQGIIASDNPIEILRELSILGWILMRMIDRALLLLMAPVAPCRCSIPEMQDLHFAKQMGMAHRFDPTASY